MPTEVIFAKVVWVQVSPTSCQRDSNEHSILAAVTNRKDPHAANNYTSVS